MLRVWCSAALLVVLGGCAAGVEDPIRLPGPGPSRPPAAETFSAELDDVQVDALRRVRPDSARAIAEGKRAPGPRAELDEVEAAPLELPVATDEAR